MQNLRISDEEIGLIKRAQAGDESAFTKLYNMYEKLVLNVIRSYVSDLDTAKDLTICTFEDAYSNLSTFTDYSSFGGWLRTIACRNAIDYIRKQRYFLNDIATSNDRLSLLDNIPDDSQLGVVDQMTYDQVLKEFNKLPKNHKRICELFYINELTVKQISKKLGIPEGTIKSVLSRIRKRFKKQFKQI